VVWHGWGGARFDGSTWTVYDRSNSGLPSNSVQAIGIESDGTKWFGTDDGGVARYDGSTWTVYNTSNSGLPSNWVNSIAIESDGTKWFGTYDGVACFDGSTWTVYDESSSGLPANYVHAVAIEGDGTKWFGTDGGGVARFDDRSWTMCNSTNSDLLFDYITSIVIGSDGTKWFGSERLVRFDGTTWTVYDPYDSGIHIYTRIRSMVIESNGTKWLCIDQGVVVHYGGYVYPVADNAEWLDDSHWRATYDVTSLVPRDTYTISVSGAQGTDGMEIPPDTRFGFSVDYAGQITDQTPPNPPVVIAGGVEGDASSVEAMWSANDPDSSITGYRYAIGSAAGATDIVHWTNTSRSSIARSELGLIDGRQYWLAVQARNEGGLWSASGYSAFVAGQPFHRVFLPVVVRSP